MSIEFGFGLRAPHYGELLDRPVRASFLEAVAENFVGRGGRPRRVLEHLAANARLCLHGVSLSVGGVDELNWQHVDALRELGASVQAAWVSDHLCFATVGGHYAHDLWPLPYTEEALEHVVARARLVRERLGRPFLLENVSSYVEYEASSMPEWEFLAEVARRADVGILLDVNNVIVSAKNHGFSPQAYVDALPPERVMQIHLAGHSDYGTHAIDDHGSAVPAEVWSLYRRALLRFGPVPSIVEWDDNVPLLAELEAEAGKIQLVAQEVLRVARTA